MAVRAERGGKRAKCPKCGRILTAPGPAELAARTIQQSPLDTDTLLDGLAKGETVDVPRPATPEPTCDRPAARDGFLDLAPREPRTTLEELLGIPQGPPQTCPSCKRSLPCSATICTDCGINIKTGRALLTTQDENLDQAYICAESVIRWFSWLAPVGMYPVASEAFGLRTPWTIRATAVTTILISIWFMFAVIYNPRPAPEHLNLMHWIGQPPPTVTDKTDSQSRDMLAANPPAEEADRTDTDAEVYAAEGRDRPPMGEYRPYQLLTSAFLHGGWLHLAGNLLFLMVLGSRVNALIGNVLTVILYPLLAIISSIVQMAAMSDGPLTPCLGASGAIMGLAGMYLVLFPLHNVHMAVWWRRGLNALFELHYNIFPVRGFFVVLFYIAFDVLFILLRADDNVGHWAHFGGFLAGVGIALVLLLARLVNARGGDMMSAVLGRYAWGLVGKPNRRGLTLW